MKTRFSKLLFPFACLALTFNSHLGRALAQGTAFSYQGRLTAGGVPANGIFDLRFTIYDSVVGGLVVAGPLTNATTAASNGLFVVTLDFGPGVFSGPSRWLDIGVRSNGSAVAYQTLTPRQALTPTPYAVTAANVTGVLPGSSLSGIYPGAVTLNNPGNVLAGDGSALSSLNATQLNGTVPAAALGNAWKIAGNTGTSPTNGNFIGTLDNQPVEVWANGTRSMRIEPNTNGAPNIIGGAPVNFVDPGIVGATIAGGGTVNGNFYLGAGSNHVAAIFGTIAGGRMNTIGADHGFIGGGISNTTAPLAYDAVIGGGVGNSISTNAYDCVIDGGFGNAILNDLSYSKIGGGYHNQINAGSSYATIAGGYFNLTDTNGNYLTIGGGGNNIIGAGNNYVTIAGGDLNIVQPNARSSTISGGAQNTISYGAIRSTISGGINQSIGTNSHHSAISGGEGNAILANSDHSIIVGGYSNSIAAPASLAAGSYAQADHPGSFVWSDSSTNTPFASTATNQFSVRASGGARFVTGGAGMTVDGQVSATSFQGDGSGLYNVSPGLGNYVFAYSTTIQNVTTANIFQDVNFSSDAQLNGWAHTPGTSQYTSAQTGLYLVQYSAEVSTTGLGTNATFRVVLNTTSEVLGSRSTVTMTSANQLSPVSRSLLTSINSGDVLTLQFLGGGTGVRLVGNASSSLTVTRIQ